MLEVKNLCKNYHTTKENQIKVLENTNLFVKEKEFVSIQGNSGTGKSTLINLIAALEKRTSGEILIHKKNMDDYKQKINEYRFKYIGFVFQNHFLLPSLNVLDNVLLPLRINSNFKKKEAVDKAMAYLEKIGLDQRAKHFPNQISGGESARVAIVRSMINQPPLVLADEPTGNLDEENTNLFVEMFLKLIKENNSSLILVTHDKELASLADTQYLLQHRTLHKI